MTSENPAGPECVISLPGTQTVCIYFRTMEKTGAAARASPLLSLPLTAGVLDLRRGQLEPVTSPLQPARFPPSACVSQGWESAERGRGRGAVSGRAQRMPPEGPDTEPAEQRLGPPR